MVTIGLLMVLCLYVILVSLSRLSNAFGEKNELEACVNFQSEEYE